VLYAPRYSARTVRYRVSASCTGYMLAGAAFRAELAAQMRRRR